LVTCTASDTSAKTGTCTFNVIVADDEAPVLAVCNNVNAKTSDDAPGNCSTTVTYTQPTALDNCDGARTVTCSPASGSGFNKGTTLVTCTVSDTSGNSSTCMFHVIVADDEPPVFSGCNDVNAKTSDDGKGNCSTVVNYTKPTATDNCDG